MESRPTQVRTKCRYAYSLKEHSTWYFLLLVQSFLLFIFALLILKPGYYIDYINQHAQSPLFQSPAADAVRYEMRYFSKYAHVTSEFARKPGPELDRAWHELLKGMNIKVSGRYLLPYHAHSVRLSDGSGYVAQLGVYHELHCLKKLKEWMHRSYYYSNLSVVEEVEEEAHVEHCLEWIRMGVLCRSDITLSVLQWDSETGSRLETEYPIPRKCIDSERILQWAERNAIDLSKEGILESS